VASHPRKNSRLLETLADIAGSVGRG